MKVWQKMRESCQQLCSMKRSHQIVYYSREKQYDLLSLSYLGSTSAELNCPENLIRYEK